MSQLDENRNRQDWFRLHNISHPPNHDRMDLTQLPPLREAFFSLYEVLTLLTDIETNATEIQLLQRENSHGVVLDQREQKKAFDYVRQAIQSGTITRLQIRYVWQNANWIDTLECGGDPIRLVRIEHRSRSL